MRVGNVMAGDNRAPIPANEKRLTLQWQGERLVIIGILARVVAYVLHDRALIDSLVGAHDGTLQVSWPHPCGPFKAMVDAHYSEDPAPAPAPCLPVEWQGGDLVASGLLVPIVAQIVTSPRLARAVGAMSNGNILVAWPEPSGPFSVRVRRFYVEARSSNLHGQID